MADATAGWNEVGERIQTLGLKLKLHWEQERMAPPEAQDALRRLGDAIDTAFEAIGAAAHDPAVREDLRQTGQALIDALGASFAEAGEELRNAVRRKGDEAPPPPPASS